MSDAILGERFWQRAEGPAWHRLGTYSLEDLSAEEAFERAGALYPVYKRPIAWQSEEPTQDSPNGRWRTSDAYRVIVRPPLPEDDQWREFGVVSDEYQLFTPRDVCDVTMRMRRPDGRPVVIESVGVLKDGAWLFVSTKLPSFDVRGEQVDNYLINSSPMTGTDAATGFVSTVCPVCYNTLMAGLSQASEKYVIRHDWRNAKQDWGDWLQDMYSRFIQRAAVLREAYDVLAAHRNKEEEVYGVIEKSYPDPVKPAEGSAPVAVYDRRVEVWEVERARNYKIKNAVLEIYEGAGRGMNLPSRRGTAWGLYGAIAENENFRRGGSDRQAATAVLFGSRRQTMERAMGACLEICGVFSKN